MTERLKELCDQHHTNFARVEKALGFANASLKKTSEKTECIRVKAIADYFGVSIEYLLTGEDKRPQSILNERDRKLIDLANTLNDEAYSLVLKYIEFLIFEGNTKKSDQLAVV